MEQRGWCVVMWPSESFVSTCPSNASMTAQSSSITLPVLQVNQSRFQASTMGTILQSRTQVWPNSYLQAHFVLPVSHCRTSVLYQQPPTLLAASSTTCSTIDQVQTAQPSFHRSARLEHVAQRNTDPSVAKEKPRDHQALHAGPLKQVI